MSYPGLFISDDGVNCLTGLVGLASGCNTNAPRYYVDEKGILGWLLDSVWGTLRGHVMDLCSSNDEQRLSCPGPLACTCCAQCWHPRSGAVDENHLDHDGSHCSGVGLSLWGGHCTPGQRFLRLGIRFLLDDSEGPLYSEPPDYGVGEDIPRYFFSLSE